MEKRKSGLITATKIFMVIGAIMTSIMTYGIGLFWCIPMTISYFNRINNGQHIGTGFKICSIIFVSQLGGILMLCDNEDDLKKANVYTPREPTYQDPNSNPIPTKQPYITPSWIKVGAKVTHKTYGKVTINSIDDEWITIVDVNGFGYKLNLEYCLKNEMLFYTSNDIQEPTEKTYTTATPPIKTDSTLNEPNNDVSENKKEIKTMEKLIANKWKQLGTNSRTIYLDCCKKYGWKEELASKLGHQGSLQFVINATDENYDVWFITHSNLNDSKTIRWKNEVSEDLSKIMEYNTTAGEEEKIKAHKIRKNSRIVFAKTRLSTGERYAFIGVYKFDTRIPLYNNPDYVAKYVYKQVSKVYPFNNDVVIPSWLKVGEKVQHTMLGQVTVTDLDERNNNVSIEEENGEQHNLNLENCLEKNVFSPIKQDPPQTTDVPPYVFIGNKVFHIKYEEVEILSLSDEFIFIQDSTKRVYYVKKEKAYNDLKPILNLIEGTTIIHKGLGRVRITKVTRTNITVIDKNGEPHSLDLKTCFEKGLLSNE